VVDYSVVETIIILFNFEFCRSELEQEIQCEEDEEEPQHKEDEEQAKSSDDDFFELYLSERWMRNSYRYGDCTLP